MLFEEQENAVANRRHEKKGDRFNRLVFIRETDDYRFPCGKTYRRAYYKCDCGNVKEIILAAVRYGKTKSCGCMIAINRDKAKTTHGESIRSKRGRNASAEYKTWLSIRRRCLSKHPDPRYAERGISVCERWNSYSAFLEDMGPKPSPAHSIDRIDNDGDYYPENCRWATKVEQAYNTSNTRYVEDAGVVKNIYEWSLLSGVDPVRIGARLRYNWESHRAIWQPIRRKSKTPRRKKLSDKERNSAYEAK